MGNKGRDIPEPDILRAAGMVKHCNSQHSAVLALGRMGRRMPRDQPAQPRPGLFSSLSLQSFHCSPQAFLEEIGQQSRHTRLSGILSSPCHSDPVSDFMCRNDSCPKTHAESGYSRAKPPELRASENARRETIPMRGLLRRVRRSRPRSQAKAPL